MLKKLLTSLIITSVFFTKLLAQSTIILPNGTVIPSMTQGNRPVAPTVGQLIYQTDGTSGLYVWNGTAWTVVSTSGGSGTVTNVTANAPISVANGTTTPALSISQANSTTNGFLSSADWNTFSNKGSFNLPSLTDGSVLFSDGTTISQNNSSLKWNNSLRRLDIKGLNDGTIGAGFTNWISTSIGGSGGNRIVAGVQNGEATIGAHNETLSAWSKLVINPAGATAVGSLTGVGTRMVVANANGELNSQPIPTLTSVTATSPLSVTNSTTTPIIGIQQANGSQNGFLGSTDWTAFNNKLNSNLTQNTTIALNDYSFGAEIGVIGSTRTAFSLGTSGYYFLQSDGSGNSGGGQSFKTKKTGTINTIRVMINSLIPNTFNYTLYRGVGKGGAVAKTGTVSMSGGPNGIYDIPINISATASEVFTIWIHYSPTNSMDLYTSPDNYPDGNAVGYYANPAEDIYFEVYETASQILYPFKIVNPTGYIGIGTATPNNQLTVNSQNSGSGTANWVAGSFGGMAGDRVVMGIFNGKATIGGHNNALSAWSKLYVSPGGGVNIGSLAGTGNRMVVADALGDLTTQTIPTFTPDNLGNHTATQAVNINNNWISNDGTAKGVRVNSLGGMGINLASPEGLLDIPKVSQVANGTFSTVTYLGATFFSSSNGQSTIPNQSFDTNINTSWHPATTTQNQNMFVGVDFGTDNPRIIKSFSLSASIGQPSSGNFTDGYLHYQVEASNDGNLYTSLYDSSPSTFVNGTVEVNTTNFTNFTAFRYYRLRFLSVSRLKEDGIDSAILPVGETFGVTEISFTQENTSPSYSSGGLTITSAGKMGIGTNAPTADVDIAGSVRLRSGAGNDKFLKSDANGNASWATLNLNQLGGTGGVAVSSTNTGSGTTDWIAMNAGGTAGDRVVMGNLNGKASIGSHNNTLNAWSDLVINPNASNTVTIGTDANAAPAQSVVVTTNGITSTSFNRTLTVNGSIRQSYFMVAVSIAANSTQLITWTHNMGYSPIVMMSTDENGQGGGGNMEFCSYTEYNNSLNQMVFKIRNLGGATANGNFRWIVVN